jgi:hypothetical protein
MDLLEQPYRSQMRLFFDSPSTLVEGAWHLSPPGALVFPDWHAFGTQRQDPDELKWDNPPVGEVRGRQGAASGVPTQGFTGQHFCGTLSAWQSGDPISAQGSQPVDSRSRPVCCQAVDPGMIRLNASSFQTAVRAWYLNADAPPANPVLAPGLVLPWVNAAHPVANKWVLSGIAGITPRNLHLAQASAVPIPPQDQGFMQFYTMPLSSVELPPQVLTMTLGWQIALLVHFGLGLSMGVVLLNGADASLKQDLTGIVHVTPLTHTAKPLRGRLATVNTGPISIASGDFLCLEIGAQEDSGGLGYNIDFTFSWEGVDRITADNQIITSAKAALSLVDA